MTDTTQETLSFADHAAAHSHATQLADAAIAKDAQELEAQAHELRAKHAQAKQAALAAHEADISRRAVEFQRKCAAEFAPVLAKYFADTTRPNAAAVTEVFARLDSESLRVVNQQIGNELAYAVGEEVMARVGRDGLVRLVQKSNWDAGSIFGRGLYVAASHALHALRRRGDIGGVIAALNELESSIASILSGPGCSEQDIVERRWEIDRFGGSRKDQEQAHLALDKELEAERTKQIDRNIAAAREVARERARKNGNKPNEIFETVSGSDIRYGMRLAGYST